MHPAEVTSNSEKIKPVALAVVNLLVESVSDQSEGLFGLSFA